MKQETLLMKTTPLIILIICGLNLKGQVNILDCLRLKDSVFGKYQSGEYPARNEVIDIKNGYYALACGWLGADVIGNQGNSTLFLVIQHADIETQEKYLPMMRDAVSKGNARASSLALLEDRVALRKGEKQIFSTQSFSNKLTIIILNTFCNF
ncbi:MAG: DUF6624 domain-containing protein [Saprospiraceae bacterium]